MHLTILNSLLNLGKNSKQRFKKVAHSSLPKGIPMRYVLLRKSYSQSHLPCTRNFATEKIGLRFYTDPLPLHKDFQSHPQDVLSFLMLGIKMFLGHGFALYGCPQTLVSWLSLRISTSSFCHEVKRKLTTQNILHRPLRRPLIILGKRGTNIYIAWFTFHALSRKHISKLLKAIEKTTLSLS